MRILFIINPAAGSHRAMARWSSFESIVRRSSGLQVDRVFTEGPGDAAQFAGKAAAEYDVLVAAGGDGTASEVASGILWCPNSRAALGILPLGTGNDLAEVMGIRSHKDALDCFADCTVQIDVLQVHCVAAGSEVIRHALLFAGVGIISDALRKTTSALKRFLGQRLAYPAGVLRALLTYESPLMKVACGKQTFEERFLFVGASNTPIAGGGMKLAPGARIDDGLLNVNLIGRFGRLGAILQLRRLCQGRHQNHRRVRYMTAESLEISSPNDLEVAVDGELIGHTPARILVRPGALKVSVPAKK